MVKNSVSMSSDQISFIITDFKNEISKIFGVMKSFSEEKGVVAEGFQRIKIFKCVKDFS